VTPICGPGPHSSRFESTQHREAILPAEPYEAALARRQRAQQAAVAGRLEEAAALYQQVLALQREIYGPSHPEVAATLHDLAVLHETMGSPDQAHALWAQARRMLES
jgi:tetratricopeptide (TPR) repeat protein